MGGKQGKKPQTGGLQGRKEPRPPFKEARTPQKEPKDAQIRRLIAELEGIRTELRGGVGFDANLTGAERRRLVGAGVKNYGFIDKAFDIARDNPAFMPPHFSVGNLAANMRELEETRQLLFVLQQLTQDVSDVFLVQADGRYRDALYVYNSLKGQTRAKVVGAEPLFQALRPFFNRRRRKAGGPTEKQLEHDVRKLLHSKADGEVIVKNEGDSAAKR